MEKLYDRFINTHHREKRDSYTITTIETLCLEQHTNFNFNSMLSLLRLSCVLLQYTSMDWSNGSVWNSKNVTKFIRHLKRPTAYNDWNNVTIINMTRIPLQMNLCIVMVILELRNSDRNATHSWKLMLFDTDSYHFRFINNMSSFKTLVLLEYETLWSDYCMIISAWICIFLNGKSK